MTEPTERDRENAEWLADRAGILPSREAWIRACWEIMAAAREEGRREERARRAFPATEAMMNAGKRLMARGLRGLVDKSE